MRIRSVVIVLGILSNLAWSAPADATTPLPVPTAELSLQGRLSPQLGSLKRDNYRGADLDLGTGAGLRVLWNVHPWWAVGLGLSQVDWSAKDSGQTYDMTMAGNYLDAQAMVRFSPVRLETPAGPLSFYGMLEGGKTLSGTSTSTGDTSRAGQAISVRTTDEYEVDSGWGAAAALGARLQSWQHFGLFAEAGYGWHTLEPVSAMRRELSNDSLFVERPTSTTQSVAQLTVDLGVALLF